MVAKLILILATAFSLVSGCQCGRVDPEKTGYDRVLIFYSAGYNSLSEYLREDIRDLKSGYAPALKEARAFFVVSHLTKIRGDYGTKTDPQLIRVYKDRKKGVILDTLKAYPGHLSDPSLMRTILSDIKRQFPAKHYGMVFSSHASGWLPVYYYNNDEKFDRSYPSGQKGVAERPLPPLTSFPYVERELLPGEPMTKSVVITNHYNDSMEMDLDDFKSAIPMHLDYLLFDACLMGCVEVAYEFKDVCDQIGFSQAEILADGFDYKSLAAHLLENDKVDTRAIVDDYYQKYASRTDKTNRSATISLVDCTRLEPLTSLCRTLFDKYGSSIATLNPSEVQRYYRYDKHWFYDLEDILVKAGISDEEHRSLTSALNQCILYKAATPEFLKNYGGFVIETFSGLSMYLPCDGSRFLDSEYQGLAWNKATGLVD